MSTRPPYRDGWRGGRTKGAALNTRKLLALCEECQHAPDLAAALRARGVDADNAAFLAQVFSLQGAAGFAPAIATIERSESQARDRR